jgi:nucleotide-binding universal stress UspA family protein
MCKSERAAKRETPIYKRILVAIDGGATSLRALNHAIALASVHNARLRLLQVVEESLIVPAAYAYPAGDFDEVIDSLWASGKRALDRGVALAAKHGIEAERVQLRGGLGPVSAVILSQARKWQADLLVMGTHGRRGLKRLILGSDAERVLREAPMPILIVRATASDQRRSEQARSRNRR